MGILRLVRCSPNIDADIIEKKKYQDMLIDKYSDIIKLKYAEGTLPSFNSALSHYIPWLNESDIFVWDVTPDKYDQFSIHLQNNIKPATVVRYNVMLSNFYDWMISRKKDEIISKFGEKAINPIDKWNTPSRQKDDNELPELPDSEAVHYYIQKEKNALKKAIETCDNRTANIIARQLTAENIMLKAGLRVAEIVNLNVGNISLKDMIMIVKKGKGGKDRIVDISAELGQLLKWYLSDAHPRAIAGERLDKNTPLFISEQNKRISKKTIQTRMWYQMRTFNLPIDKYFSPHGLRRLYATNLYKELINEKHPDPLTYIKIQLGHVFYSTTLRYCRVEKAIASRSVNKAISSVKENLLMDVKRK